MELSALFELEVCVWPWRHSRPHCVQKAALPGAHLFHAVFPSSREGDAFEGLLEAIQDTMTEWNSHALLICDQGKETTYTRSARRRQYNPLALAGSTGPDPSTRPLDRILEDPFYKQSDQSYFIQLSNFCAYALLRRENPLASKTRYGLDRSFDLLAPTLASAPGAHDPEGTVRP